MDIGNVFDGDSESAQVARKALIALDDILDLGFKTTMIKPIFVDQWGITRCGIGEAHITGIFYQGFSVDNAPLSEGSELTLWNYHIIGAMRDKYILTRVEGYVLILGDADPEYERLYPDARNRFFKTWGVEHAQSTRRA